MLALLAATTTTTRAASHSGDAIDWTVVGVLLTALFTGALALIALYTLKHERFSSRKRERVERKRAELKALLGDQMGEAIRLLGDSQFGDTAAVPDWNDRTANLINAALGQAEAYIFLMQPVPYEIRKRGMGHEHLEWLERRKLKLSELIERLETIPLRDDFKPEEWKSKGDDA
jgi:hypothetical protein